MIGCSIPKQESIYSKKLLGDISTIALVIWSVDTTDPRTKNACLRAIATSGREYKVQKLTLLIKEMTTAVSARYGIIFPEKGVNSLKVPNFPTPLSSACCA